MAKTSRSWARTGGETSDPTGLSQLCLLRTNGQSLESSPLRTCCVALQSLGRASLSAARLRLGTAGTRRVKKSIPTQMSGWVPLPKSWWKQVYRSRNSHVQDKFLPAKSYEAEGWMLAEGKTLEFLGMAEENKPTYQKLLRQWYWRK